MKFLFNLITIFLFSVSSSHAILSEDSQKALENEGRPYVELAVKGDANAQYKLGMLFQKYREQSLAYEWLEKAAKQGHENAQYELITLHEKEDRYNDSQIFQWSKKFAEKGDVKAQCVVGMFYKGKRDYQQAFFWLNKSAEQGEPCAQFNLSEFYLEGNKGVKQDINKTLELLNKSAEQGYEKAQAMLAELYYQGYETRGFSKDIVKAKYWIKKLCEQHGRSYCKMYNSIK